MKQLAILFVAFLALTTTACRKRAFVTGSGSIVSETRTLANFNNVNADGSTRIEIYPSTTNKVIVTGYQNLVPAYETSVSGNTLNLHYRDEYYRVKNDNITIQLYVTDLSRFNLNGSGNVTFRQGINSNSLTTEINGSGDIYFEQNDFNTLNFKVNGSGNISGQQAKGENVRAEISGSGDIDVTVGYSLDAHISGSGK